MLIATATATDKQEITISLFFKKILFLELPGGVSILFNDGEIGIPILLIVFFIFPLTGYLIVSASF